jgi:outer membrane protein OmpA-like peptidoglycan-associated protein
MVRTQGRKDQKRHTRRVGWLVAAALLVLPASVQAGGNPSSDGSDAAPRKLKIASASSSNVAVNYDALDSLGGGDGPIVVGDGIVLKPPRGVARYKSTGSERVNLAAYSCPCAHRLKLHPPKSAHKAVHRKSAAKVAKIEPAAVGAGSMPSQGIPTKVASEPLAPPPTPVPATPPTPPAPVVAKPAPAPAPVVAEKPMPQAAPVAAPKPAPVPQTPPPPAPKIVAAPPPAPVAPPPAKVAAAPPAPTPAPAANAPTTTSWSTPGAATPTPAPAKSTPPNVSLPQVLTPPPPAAKAPEKVEPKVEAKVEPKPEPKVEEKVAAVPPAPPQPASAKPIDITKPATETAALSPAPVKATETKPAAPPPLIVSYAGGGSAVPEASVLALKDVSAKLAADSNLRVQLFSYASDAEKNVSRSRRLSLERAVAVRKLLIDNGLDSTRIEVRALGDQNTGGESDRVDVILSARR